MSDPTEVNYTGFQCKEHFISQATVPSDFTKLSTFTYLLPKPDMGKKLEEVSQTSSRKSSFGHFVG